MLISVLFVLLLSILNLIRFLTGINTVIEEFFVRRVLALGPDIYGASPMSPIAAASFLLACTSMILFLAYTRRTAGLSGAFASVVVSMNLVILLGYLYGTPVLYGGEGEIRPVSLPSGIAFVFLGTGLIASSGPGHFPLRLLVGKSMRALLLRTFFLVIFIFALVHAVVYNLFSYLIVNEALRTALAVLISSAITGVIVLRLSRTIGGTIDHAEAERKKAEEALRRAYDELEIKVLERTAELTKTNEALQAEITERKRIGKELQIERDRIQKYLNIAGVMIVALDANQKIILMNKKCCEILGCREEEVIGKNWFDTFIPERARHEAGAVFAELMAGKIEPVEFFENPVLTRNGEERLIAWHNTVLKDDAGNITGILSSGEDITERRRTEEKLRRAKELSDALNNINTVINSTLDFDEIMRRVIVESAKAIGCETTAITLREEDYWVIRYTYGFTEKLIGSQFTDTEIPHGALAARTKQPVVINNVFSDERANLGVVKKFVVRSVLIIPLIVREMAIGLIYFNYHSAAIPFTGAQIDFANKLGASLTLALENARLFKAEQESHRKEEERAGRFETLHQITNIAISSLDPKDIARDAITSLSIKLGFSTASIWLADKAKEELLSVASVGYPQNYFEMLPPIKFDSQFEISRIFSSGRTAVVEDFTAAPVSEILKEAYSKAGIKAGSYIAIPLKSKKEIVGVIGIIRQEPRKFRDFLISSGCTHKTPKTCNN